MNLMELGSRLRLGDHLLQSVNGEYVGYVVPSSVIPEASWPSRLLNFPRMWRNSAAGRPTVERYSVNSKQALDVVYYPYHVTLQLVGRDDASI